MTEGERACRLVVPLVCAALGFGWGARAAWSAEIAPGVTHTVYAASGPNVVHVVAIDRLRAEYKLKVGWPQKKRNFTSKARTSDIAALYDSPPGHDVLAATNGSFFGVVPDITGTAASDGQILQRPDSGQNDTFFFGPSRVPAIVASVGGLPGRLTFANGTTLPIEQYNIPPAIHKTTAFTPAYDTSTRSQNNCTEVILSDVTYPMRGDKEVSGIVTAVRTGAAGINNAIPAGGMVLNAWGIPESTIQANAHVGDRLRMRFDTTADEYNNADMAITGIGWILHNGAANTADWALHGSLATDRHPRTVLAWSDSFLFMVVCDGRSAASVGMSFQEMSNFLTGTLNAVEAVNLDGGGSSTCVVNGMVMNTPSDGNERIVANAVLLVRQDTATVFPFTDLFAPAGRLAGWDDKFAYNAATAFSPNSPGGDGHVLKVMNPAGGANTVRRGDFGDTDYSVEADVYCEYRPGEAPDGYERGGLFARDSGTGALGLAAFGGGNCYAMMYDSDTGAIRAGKYVNGALADFIAPGAATITSSGWHRFRIGCYASKIRYELDGARIASVSDGSFARGYFGIGHHEFFTTDANIHGARVDNLHAFVDPAGYGIRGDFDEDGDVDQEDFGVFQLCFSGNGNLQADPACGGAKLDADGDVDSFDFALFQACFSGPNLSPPLACQGQ